MSDVEFPEEQSFLDLTKARKGEPQPSGLIAFFIRVGLAKDATGANILLGAVGMLALLLTAAILLFVFS